MSLGLVFFIGPMGLKKAPGVWWIPWVKIYNMKNCKPAREFTRSTSMEATPFAIIVLFLLAQVLVTLVHAKGMENLAEKWIKELKKESQDMDKLQKVEELEMMSKTEVEKVVERSGVLVISAPQNSLGCVLHSQLARSSAYLDSLQLKLPQ